MIEMARIFHKLNLLPLCNIDFMACGCEELGLYGSLYDAKKRKNQNEKIVLIINNDMVDYQPEDEEWKMRIHWYDNAIPMAQKAIDLCLEYTCIETYLPDDENNAPR